MASKKLNITSQSKWNGESTEKKNRHSKNEKTIKELY